MKPYIITYPHNIPHIIHSENINSTLCLFSPAIIERDLVKLLSTGSIARGQKSINISV